MKKKQFVRPFDDVDDVVLSVVAILKIIIELKSIFIKKWEYLKLIL